MQREKRRVCSCPVGKFLVSSDRMDWMIVERRPGESVEDFIAREGIEGANVTWKPLPAPATPLDMGVWNEGFSKPYEDVLVLVEGGDMKIAYTVENYDGSIGWECGVDGVLCWTEL